MKVSRVCKVNGKMFRYNFDESIVELVTKADKEMRSENDEWMSKFGKNLWDIDDQGYVVLDGVGLSKENWRNKESRMEYLSMWAGEIEEETKYMISSFR